MPEKERSIKQIVTNEAALFLGLFFVGFAILPVAIYFVGNAVFGAFEGNGYNEFFSSLSGRIRSGDRAAWFLVASPYLAIMTLRLMAWGWRGTARA